jgi:hypothetical protein
MSTASMGHTLLFLLTAANEGGADLGWKVGHTAEVDPERTFRCWPNYCSIADILFEFLSSSPSSVDPFPLNKEISS